MLLPVIISLVVITFILGNIIGWEKFLMGVYNNIAAVGALIAAAIAVTFLLNKGVGIDLMKGIISFAVGAFVLYILFVWAFSGKFPWFK
jgi:hypothetical protein